MTHPTYTVTKATQNSGFDMYQRPMNIKLKAAPFEIPAADYSEVTPRSLPIRMAKLSSVDKHWLRGVERVRG